MNENVFVTFLKIIKFVSSFHWYYRWLRRQRTVSCFWSDGSGIAGHERVSLSPFAIVVYLTRLIVFIANTSASLGIWNVIFFWETYFLGFGWVLWEYLGTIIGHNRLKCTQIAQGLVYRSHKLIVISLIIPRDGNSFGIIEFFEQLRKKWSNLAR